MDNGLVDTELIDNVNLLVLFRLLFFGLLFFRWGLLRCRFSTRLPENRRSLDRDRLKRNIAVALDPTCLALGDLIDQKLLPSPATVKDQAARGYDDGEHIEHM